MKKVLNKELNYEYVQIFKEKVQKDEERDKTQWENGQQKSKECQNFILQ